jgi:hypothetical protein
MSVSSTAIPHRFLTGRFMWTHLFPPAQRAQNEFALTPLGDQRRTQRLMKIAAHVAAAPGGTLP